MSGKNSQSPVIHIPTAKKERGSSAMGEDLETVAEPGRSRNNSRHQSRRLKSGVGTGDTNDDSKLLLLNDQ